MRHQRILWLPNHTTLRDFEVPLLIDLGFEVFVPKIFPVDEANKSASISYNYDSTLSISQEKLHKLNSCNFYDQDLTLEVIQIINQEFDIAISAFFPQMLKTLLKKFKGFLFIRVFGREGHLTYQGLLDQELKESIYKRSHKIYFAQAYPEISLNETGIFHKTALTLPLGLPKSFYKNENTWKGNERKILFICPRITSSPAYYGKIYSEFKKYFGDLPHIIGGAQPAPVNDPNVLGFQPREVLDSLLQDCAVMFYHSREPRHLHYHPLEAIVYGMPLIYMSGGLLESLGGQDQHGMCQTEQEAKQKIERILNGDTKLISDIQCQQKKILESFSYDYCKAMWKSNFLSAILIKKTNLYKSKIAIFLPAPYRGGSMRAAKNLAKMIAQESKKDGEAIGIVFSCLKEKYKIEEEFVDLIEQGIQIRETEWKTISREETKIALDYLNNRKELKHENYFLPNDGINNFSDCDFWLIISDRTSAPIAPIAPIAPYGMLIYDYIQRYIPDIFGEDQGKIDLPFIHSARDAEVIFCTTPQTKEDTTQYAGVSSSKVILAPMEFNPLHCKIHSFFDEVVEYFIWTSNATQHKNHHNALKAFEYYYEELNGRLKIIMTGVQTELFQKENTNQIPYIVDIRGRIQKNPILRDNIQILGELSEKQYVSVLSGAKFLFHPVLYDNGTFAVIEAAYYGVPSVSSNYPQMCYIDERFGLGMHFFNPRKPHEIAKALKYAEENQAILKKQLPSQESLESFTHEKLAEEYWTLIRGYL